MQNGAPFLTNTPDLINVCLISLFLLPLFGDVPLADYCSTIRASEGSQVPCSAGCRRECWQLTRQSLRLMALAQQSLHDSCTLLSSSSSSSSSSFPFASSSFPPHYFSVSPAKPRFAQWMLTADHRFTGLQHKGITKWCSFCCHKSQTWPQQRTITAATRSTSRRNQTLPR